MFRYNFFFFFSEVSFSRKKKISVKLHVTNIIIIVVLGKLVAPHVAIDSTTLSTMSIRWKIKYGYYIRFWSASVYAQSNSENRQVKFFDSNLVQFCHYFARLFETKIAFGIKCKTGKADKTNWVFKVVYSSVVHSRYFLSVKKE